MRNLKRALSLTLASVMLLGMMVVGTSAASFPDVTEKDNVEAIEVLAEVKVLQGYDDGQYHADTPVTRNQMATIICRMMGWRDGDFAGLNPFPDVPDWAANYVAACVANGIINGRDDGRFHGDDTVTATEAASMMLRALGYTRMPVGADWARAVAQQASKINLFDSLDVGAYTALTRGDVAQLSLNTLESTLVDVEDNTLSIEAGNGVSISGGQINYVVRTAANNSVMARAIKRNVNSGGGLDGTSGQTIELGEQVYNGDLKKVDSYDAFGAPSSRWTYKNVEVGNYAVGEDYKFEGTVKSEAMYEAVGKNAAENYRWIVTMDGASIDWQAASDKQALFTGSDVADNDRDDLAGTHRGATTYVYLKDEATTVNGTGYAGTAYACIVNTYAAEVIKATGKTITLDDMEKSGMEYDTTGYAEGDVVLYTKSTTNDGSSFTVQNILGKAELIEGKAEVVRESTTANPAGDRVTLGGKDYNYSNRFNSNNGGKLRTASAGENVAFYLDRQGNIIHMGDVEESNDYAYVYAVGQGTNTYDGETTYGATLIMTDGTKKKVDLDKDTYKPFVDAANAAHSGNASAQQKLDEVGKLVGHIVSYTVEDDGDYDLTVKSTYKATWTKTASVAENILKEGLSRVDVTTTDVAGTNGTYQKWTATTGNQGSWGNVAAAILYANKNSAILVNESTEDNDKFNVYTGYEALPNVNAVAKIAGQDIETTMVAYVNDGVIRAMFLMDAEISGSSKDAIFIIGQGRTPKVYDDSSNEYHVYDVVQDGEITSIRVKNGSAADTALCAIADKQVGIFFKIKTDSKGFVTDVEATLPTDIAVNGTNKDAQSGAQAGGDWSADKYTGVGRVDGELRFDYDPDSDTWGVRPGTGNDALVVYYTEAEKLSLEGIHADRNDECYVITDDGKIIAIFVKEIKDGGASVDNKPKPPVSTGNTYVDLSTKATVMVYYKDGTTAPTEDKGIELIEAALVAKHGSDATIEINGSDSSAIEFAVKKGNMTTKYVWDSSDVAEAYVGTVDNKEVWIDKAGDTSSPKLKDANIKNGVTMTGTYAKVVTGTGLTGTPAKDDHVAIGSGSTDAGIVVTGNGFSVNSGFVKVTGATDTDYAEVNKAYTIPADTGFTSAKGTGVTYSVGGTDKGYLVYGGSIPAGNVTGDIVLTQDYVTVSWKVADTLTGVAVDTTANDNTAYIKLAAGQNLQVTVTKADITGSETTNSATVTGVTAGGAITVTPAAGKAAITFTVDASSGITGNVEITVATLSLS